MSHYNGCGCGGHVHNSCNSCTSHNEIQQAVNDALAFEKENLEQYENNAAQSASDAAKEAAKAAESASAAAQSQTNAETAAGTATQAASSVTNTAVVLEETAERIEQAQDLLEEQISAIQTKPVYFEVSTPTSSLVLPETETVFNVRSIYIASARQDVGYGFTFDKPTRTVSLADEITAEDIANTEEGFILVTVICDVYSSDDPTSLGIILASSAGATNVGTDDDLTVQGSLDLAVRILGYYGLGSYTLKKPNDRIIYSGDEYAVADISDLPLTLTGDWATDSAKLNRVSDINLRTQLAASTGSALIGGKPFVSPYDFGAVGSSTVDNTAYIKQAIESAVSTGRCLSLIGGPWVISESLDFTLVRSIITDYTGRFLILDSSTFVCNNDANFAICFGDPDTDYSTNRATYMNLIGYMFVLCSNRTTALNGVFIKGALMNLGSIRATGFNGYGIRLGAVWDTTIQSLSVELCGNITTFAFAIDAFGDTSNCLNIGRIQCERAYHKQMRINVIRSEIHSIHAERLFILTTDDGTTGLPSGLNYINSSFLLSNSAIYQSILDSMESTSVGTVSNAPSIVLSLYTSKCVAAQMSGYISSIYGLQGTIDNSVLSRYYNQAYPYTLTNCRFITGSQDGICSIGGSGTIILGGVIDTLIPGYNTTKLLVIGATINNNYAASNTGLSGITFRDTIFKGVVSQTGPTTPTEPTRFINCNIATFNGYYQHYAIIEGGYIATVNLASRAFVTMLNVKGGTFTYTGDRGFITRGCNFNTVTQWGTPSFGSYPIGERTQRMGALASGNGVEFMNTTAAGATFVAIITYTAAST